MGVARRVAATVIALLSLWQLIVLGFWGLLGLLFSRGLFGSAEASSTPRQVALALALLLLAVLNPVTAFAMLLRGSTITGLLVVAILVLDLIAAVTILSGSPTPWTDVAAPIISAVLLIVAFPRRAPV